MRLLLLGVLAAGCGTLQAYDGDARPAAEVARLSTSDAKQADDGLDTKEGAFVTGLRDTYSAAIVRVDGRRMQPQSKVDVLPGPHEVELKWKRSGARPWVSLNLRRRGIHRVPVEEGRVTLAVDVRAGREYRLVWDAGPYRRFGDEWVRVADGPAVRFEESGD